MHSPDENSNLAPWLAAPFDRPPDALPLFVADDSLVARILLRELSSIGQLAAGVAYELEPHLTRIAAAARDALRALGPPPSSDFGPERSAALQEALDAADCMKSTIRGLAAFTTCDAQRPGPVAVHEALELALQIAAPELLARATIVRQYGPLPPVRATLPRLAHVFLNLLRNAAESIPPSMPFANTIRVETKVDADGQVSVEIADTGIGIDGFDLPYVFDPFYTTKGELHAVGLGLSMAHVAIAQLGGTISVDTRVGRGSRFRVRLPRATSSFADDVPPEPFPRETPPHQRVLCVGVTALDARRLERLFSSSRALRLAYASVAEAFERVALGERFDLVVCDARSGSDFRSKIGRVAPDMLSRVFEIASKSAADVFRRPRSAGFGLTVLPDKRENDGSPRPEPPPPP